MTWSLTITYYLNTLIRYLSILIFKWMRGKELGEKEVEGQKFKVER